MQEICQRAGLSRGAQQHHFTTKADLMTSALEHLFARLSSQILAATAELPPGPERLEQGIDLLWRRTPGTLSTAAVELWVAARTDAGAAPQPAAGGPRARPRDTGVLPRDHGRRRSTTAQLETLLLLTVNLVRGLALDAMIGGDARRRTALLAEWKTIVLEHYGAERW